MKDYPGSLLTNITALYQHIEWSLLTNITAHYQNIEWWLLTNSTAHYQNKEWSLLTNITAHYQNIELEWWLLKMKMVTLQLQSDLPSLQCLVAGRPSIICEHYKFYNLSILYPVFANLIFLQ